MSSGTRLQLLLILLTVTCWYCCYGAPAACRSCTNGSCNNTDDGSVDEQNPGHNRTKRESTIEQRSCVQFQLEMVLIPLSIALIPLGLCALLLCACCCGPEESRGKMPERFSKKNLKSMSSKTDANEIDDVELVCKDGVVMRRDSKKTRFSTAISIIEARRISVDGRRPSMFTISPVSSQGTIGEVDETSQSSCTDLPQMVAEDHTDEKHAQAQNAQQQHISQPDLSGDEAETVDGEVVLPRRTTSKRTRFAENVSVLGDSNA